MSSSPPFKTAAVWNEFSYRGRDFVRATVPHGINAGLPFVIAKRLAERYEVRKFFASGGCGLLLEGRDLCTEANVLIKTTLRFDGIVTYAQSRDEEGIKRRLTENRKLLQTERRVMVLLKNRGCNGIPNPNDYVFDWNPQLEELFQSQGGGWQYQDIELLSSEHYLIMERMEGRPLTEVIKKGMPERTSLQILAHVCHVLAVLHQPTQREGREWKLVYQDLKPDNILIGEQNSVALLDLGGCRLTVGTTVGNKGAFTPGYCPPECQTGDTLTPTADSYTVGSTLFHMLTGRRPEEFLGSNAAVGGPQSVSFRNWDWPRLEQTARRETQEFIRRCLSPTPSERPADGRALVAEIEHLLKGSAPT
ncbi:serine/threonine protein kinase [Schlesneria sp. T3-172]|uniref:serine/threonine protein kinase n=1 Tax=Schlesneria sphaerica TaxID=3373610 RepID=UPI0037C66F23